MPPLEPELLEPVDQCTSDGRLNPAAIGWARRPLVRAPLAGGWPRRKRWHHWCVTREDLVLTLTFADLDYLGLAAVWFLDLATGLSVERAAVVPLGWRRALPASPSSPGGDVVVRAQGLSLAFTEEAAGTRLCAEFRSWRHGAFSVDVLARRPAGHETLDVVVPFDPGGRRFQYTSKQTALPATGAVTIGARSFSADGAFAALDYGRGVWPWRIAWNWGCGSGVQAGRTLGLNLGGRWTDGTGVTENGLVVDGRLHKIHDDVDFVRDPRDPRRPWTVRARAGQRVDLRFDPVHVRALGADLGLAAARLHLVFGHWSGVVVDDVGTPIRIDGLFGWAEEFRARW